ncbi:substrate-binding domain-containing protein [Gorillibacterium sp. sgz500922]|uniref:substrate-binding domain-containing protein n=1 Tax=Gorillibacterium sp. sgz500922 TaxID=3446694 RepID=UPI003F680F53
MKANVTMRDIAERLGISSVTVSKALGDREGVSEELKEKIKQVAAEMGYRMNMAAKSMREGYTYNIGVVVSERFTRMTNSFYLRFYEQISKVLEEYKYSAILHILTGEDESSFTLPRIYLEGRVDGLIVLGQLERDYVTALAESGAPLVFLDFYSEQSGMDCVITDNFYGMYEMTNYLIGNGHRDLAFVGHLYATSSIQDRFLGFYKSLLEHRIPLGADRIIRDRSEEGQLVETFELPEPMPTAFVCNCDQVAYNLISFLNKKGICVPEDCSVTGFDNDLFATLCDPPLTTVEVNMPEMARAAALSIIRRQSRESVEGRILVKGKLLLRDSVRRMDR